MATPLSRDVIADSEAIGLLYRKVRAQTCALIEGLSDADATAQSMPDASPAKWHLAHTTWFFETMVLAAHDPRYRLFDPRYAFLFNSYYETIGARHARPKRGLLTRPTLDEIERYRAHVDAGDRAAAGSAQPSRAVLTAHRAGLPSRAAAPGTAAHRHPAPVRAESAASGLCTRAAGRAPWRGSAPPDLSAATRAASLRSVMRVRASPSTAKGRGTALIRPAFRLAQSLRDQSRVAGVHGRRRLPHAAAVAVGRLD